MYFSLKRGRRGGVPRKYRDYLMPKFGNPDALGWYESIRRCRDEDVTNWLGDHDSVSGVLLGFGHRADLVTASGFSNCLLRGKTPRPRLFLSLNLKSAVEGGHVSATELGL